ncbi:acetyl-CoA C-acetyltransferase [Marinovum sp. 2_MG-2023]|uniref:acetyl-CoA C-acetyltransferase n=1 Tax=unclassified Marinovum TaxID=2647166 RepID=UPI0026E3C828|nr:MULTISPECIES: acetyl-CoA C-acetyltransferase [unclassified Marinovum]MDO6729082.1 acetyl-CoA C-acetyltransferase [Marinovum sp. 2_MG-2023]MDO6779291.1 acetyl-CoA C-acetyltransferase [Marinovum sp. 1_MG-2023]
MEQVYIAAAKRSPIGKLNGAFTGLSAADINAQVIRALLAETGLDAGALDEVLLGQVLIGGAGQNPARQAAMGAGIPVDVPAVTLNMVCGAGQKSIHMAAQAIKAGDAGLILAGGQDSMTSAPHIMHVRSPQKMGDATARDMMLTDGLWDVFNDIHMGATVEQLAARYQVSREEQDAFALMSQKKAATAIRAGHFAQEIAPVVVPAKGGDRTISADEHPRPDVSAQDLAAMRPVFDPEGTLTVGNSSGLNDGSAALLVGSERRLREVDQPPLARIASYASAALDPMDMGLGPALAARKALDLAGWRAADLDVIELNEAFAAQAIAVNREIGWDDSKINPNGGAIALGHPLAGSGARIVVTLLHQMKRTGAKMGLAALCIGGGQGVAICLETC